MCTKRFRKSTYKIFFSECRWLQKQKPAIWKRLTKFINCIPYHFHPRMQSLRLLWSTPPSWSIAPKTELYLCIEFGCYTSLGVFLALLLRIQVFIASWVRKREATMTKLLAKYLTIVIVNVLHHPRYSSLFIFHNLRNDRRKLEVCLLALF